jgi:hypothetical protein
MQRASKISVVAYPNFHSPTGAPIPVAVQLVHKVAEEGRGGEGIGKKPTRHVQTVANGILLHVGSFIYLPYDIATPLL